MSHAEQRQVTALFCDLVDSVSLTVRLDPEELMTVFDLYLAACDDIVSEHRGQVMQYMGDGVLAYFGYARSTEDDVANGVRAALRIRDALGSLVLPVGVTLRSRIGVATDRIVVNDQGGRGDGIVGGAPHIAARLQALGKPNMVVVDDTTRRLAGDGFAWRELGTFRLTGFPDAITAYEAL